VRDFTSDAGSLLAPSAMLDSGMQVADSHDHRLSIGRIIQMSDTQEPAVQRRRLRVALRELRQKSGFSQKEVAAALDWSPSKLLRIENGSVTISRSDLLAVLAHYGVTDKIRVDELLAMAQTARKQSWSEYRGVLNNETLIFIEFERAASRLRYFTPFAVPGLLQTEEYAVALLRALSPEIPEEQVRLIVQSRMERQELLNQDDPPEIFFILDEAVVRRRVGSGKVMVRQLERMREISAHPKIHIQILPFSVGPQTRITEPFTVLEFPDPADDDVLYVERVNLISRDNPEEIQRYKATFFALEDLATPKGRAGEVIGRTIEQMEDQADHPQTGEDL
jgi:transcriptional regulator with XRE-family HTH domain